MFVEILKDIYQTKLKNTVWWIALIALMVIASVSVHRCTDYIRSKQTVQIEHQKQVIDVLVDNAKQEASKADTDREVQQQSLDRLVTHIQKQTTDEKEFETIKQTALDSLIAPPVKKVAPKKPKVRDAIASQPPSPQVNARAERSQHNYHALRLALEQARAKAEQMSFEGA